VESDREGLNQRRVDEADALRESVEDMLGHGDVLGEGAVSLYLRS
jgi:hypothetical protein